MKPKKILGLALLLCFQLPLQAQQITLKLDNVTVKSAMETLQKEYGYSFVFESSDVNTQKVISVSLQGQTIDEAVRQILQGQELAFEVKDKTVVVRKQPPQAPAAPQQRLVQGVITDLDGGALAGVSVMVKGTTIGATTGVDGSYDIVAPADAMLVFSFLGMGLREEPVNGRGRIDLQLLNDAMQIDEVVVVAYGTQRKRDLTGAVSVVDAATMKKMVSPNIGQALQSLATGVSVTTSGRPGSGSDIRIRGVGSFSDVGPLYVVDGMILDGSQREFNVNDVESVQVLKDASATALYGSRGANGVILVTTKRGKEGPTKVDFSATMGVQQIANRIETMNSVEFLRVNRMAYDNAGKEWPGEPTQGQLLVNTDWQDAFFQNAMIQDYNLNVSGGNSNGNYLLSFGYYNQDGVVKGPTHDRLTIRSNAEARKGWFTFGEILLVAHSSTVPMLGAPFIDLARMPPVIPVYDESMADGYGTGSSSYQTYGSNPIGLQETSQHRQTSKRIIGNAYVQMEPIKGLQLKSNIGVEYHNWFDRELDIYKQVRYLSVSTYDNQLLERKGNFTTWMWENTISYTNTIGKHHFDALLGYTAQERTEYNHVALVKDLVDGFWVLSAGVTEPSVSGTDSESSMTSLLGRVNYNYDGKYLLQVNARRDGSSRFGANYRYGVFPSASVGWRISEEGFFSAAKPVVNDLKLRASWGILGDQQALPNYAYATYITQGTDGAIFGAEQTYYPGAIQKGRANPDLRWEQKTTINAGIDFALLSQKLYGSAEYFSSDSKDLLLQLPIAWTSGTDITPWTNYGSVRNEGFELMLGWRETQKKFKYNLAVNLTSIHTEVLELGESYREAGISGVNRSEEGRSVGDFYVIRTDGIFQSMDEVYEHTAMVWDEASSAMQSVVIQPNAVPGDIRYKDINNDGKIDKDDREYVGSPFPKFELGLSFSAEYKNFDLSLFLAGVYGNKIFNNVKYWMERMDETSNLPKGLQPWTADNHSTTTPRAFMGPNDNTIVYSDRWIEDGSYIRLKNVQLGYSLPSSLWSHIKFVGSARVYAGVQNLFTLTSYSGFDPEISGGSIFGKGNDDGHFPPVRIYTLGLQMSF
jgi:TonB-linked SusC/RagA family outer membrane protein